MKWSSTASVLPRLPAAVTEAAGVIRRDLGGSPPDLLIAFVSAEHAADFDELPGLLAAEIPTRVLVGCSAGGVIGGGRELEQRAGLSLTAALLPDVEIHPFYVDSDSVPADSRSLEWQRRLGLASSEKPHFILLPDPFSFDVERCLRGLDRAYPESCKIGGLSSGGRQPGANALFLDRHVYRSGAVVLAFSGGISVNAIVAQGCRPIGLPMFVTRCDRNVVWELDGRRPLEVLRDLHASLDEHDRGLARHSLFLGVAMAPDECEYRRGDFLIRNLIGADAESGALAVGALVRPASVVQFHLRDARTSAEDLDELLKGYRRNHPGTRPEGSLLFSCLGRGQFLYGHADHDTRLFERHLGSVPLGGFFCNGEIGPVRGTTFLHGYTSAFALFEGT